jgi:hypothetical protein
MQDYENQAIIKAEIQAEIQAVCEKILLKIDWNPIVRDRALRRLSDANFQVNKA